MLRKLITAAAMLVMLSVATPATAQPDHFIVAVPVATDQRGAKVVYDEVLELLKNIEPGQTIEAVVGPTNEQLFVVEAPSTMSDHPEFRRRLLGPAVEKLQAYSREAYAAGQTAAGPPNQTRLHDVITTIQRRAAEGVEVVILGSARAHDPRRPDADTVESIPNDAMLGLPIEASRFGAAGLEGTLRGVRFHMCVVDDAYLNAEQDAMLERYAGLRIEKMGGVLATWEANVANCMRRARAGRDDGRRRFEVDPSAKTPGFIDISSAVIVPPTTPGRTVQLAREMPVSDLQRRRVVSLVNAGDLSLARVKVFDIAAEDGDRVIVSGGGARFEVALMHEPREIVVPIEDGKLVLIGAADGGGGITVGIQTADGRQSFSPRMRVGEEVQVPFLFQ